MFRDLQIVWNDDPIWRLSSPPFISAVSCCGSQSRSEQPDGERGTEFLNVLADDSRSKANNTG